MHGLRLAGSAHPDEVARFERKVLADEADNLRAAEDHLGGAGLLDDVAIEPRGEQQVVVVEATDQHRAKRTKSIATFGAPPLNIALGTHLPVALRNVVTAGN